MPSRPQSILGLSAVPFPRRNPSSSPRRRAVRCPSPRLRAPSLLPSHLMFFSRNAFRDLDPIDSPASMASSKKVATRDEWERKLRDVKIRKEDMNRLVMNFLVTEGFVDAADKFRIESGTQPEIDLAIIADRMEVKRAVQSGNVQEAIEKINDLNPTVRFCLCS
ncbi:LisH and RanBPM domains containing protein [Zea mays]|uniref:LisH and RanBPM domains containing protein n=1 Tax=Zea mays TaxID=4577 RepID=A0A1D6JVD1_MAIZE|nr:LisH and RanBPM domains containing protein [Zea mays]